MKAYRKELWFNAPERMHFTNITPEVRDCLSESGIKEGLLLVSPKLEINARSQKEIIWHIFHAKPLQLLVLHKRRRLGGINWQFTQCLLDLL